jgi:hypothetical protein
MKGSVTPVFTDYRHLTEPTCRTRTQTQLDLLPVVSTPSIAQESWLNFNKDSGLVWPSEDWFGVFYRQGWAILFSAPQLLTSRQSFSEAEDILCQPRSVSPLFPGEKSAILILPIAVLSCLFKSGFLLTCLLVLGMGFHVLIWRVNSVVADAVVVSLLGLLVGPTFPLVLDIATNPNTKQAPGVSTTQTTIHPLMSWKDTKSTPYTPSRGTIDGPFHCVSPSFEKAALKQSDCSEGHPLLLSEEVSTEDTFPESGH